MLHLLVSPLGHWGLTRDWRRLVIAIPVLIAFMTVTTIAIAVASQRDDRLANWYVDCSTNSIKSNDTQSALLFADSAVRFNSSPPALMNLATTSLKVGDQTRGMQILQSLAGCEPGSLKAPKRRGYPPAHLAIARLLLDQPQVSVAAAAIAEKHLLQIVDLNGEDGIEVSVRLGKLYLTKGRPHWAIPFLRQAPPRSADRVFLAMAAVQSGETDLAEAEAGSCIDTLQLMLQANPRDINTVLLLANCRSIMKEYPAALQVLDDALVLASAEDAQQIRRLQTNVYVSWITFLEKDAAKSVPARLNLLERALHTAPGDARLLIKLTDFVNPPTKDAARAERLIQEQLSQGYNVGLCHLMLGNFAWQRDDKTAARMHLEQAYKLMPNAANVANNLAWMLAHQEPPALERALQVVEVALEQSPNSPEYRNTRGVILKKMKRWKEALPDFEISLAARSPADRKLMHANLAEMYDELGDPVMAAIHRAKADPSNK